jgi:hypothetical protein
MHKLMIYFTILSHKWQKKAIENKMYILTFSKKFIWHIPHYKNIRIHVISQSELSVLQKLLKNRPHQFERSLTT